MCLAIPGRITAIEGDTAVIDYDGIRKKANISLIECDIDDYVLVHVGFAIQKVDEKRARETYRLLSELDPETGERITDERMKDNQTTEGEDNA